MELREDARVAILATLRSGIGLGVTRLLDPVPVAARMPDETSRSGPAPVIPGFIEPATA